jgi:hypothetical protein
MKDRKPKEVLKEIEEMFNTISSSPVTDYSDMSTKDIKIRKTSGLKLLEMNSLRKRTNNISINIASSALLELDEILVEEQKSNKDFIDSEEGKLLLSAIKTWELELEASTTSYQITLATENILESSLFAIEEELKVRENEKDKN